MAKKATKKTKKEPARPRVVLIAHNVDAMFELAARAVYEEGNGSTSLIQRRLKIGYARAAHLLDLLEEHKCIMPADGAEPRLLMGVQPLIERKTETLPKEDPKPKKMGQPTIYSLKLVTDLCKRIAYGESLRQICKSDEMPAMSTVMNWMLEEEKKTFHEMYERSRALQAEVLFDETLEIADDGTNDWYDREVGEGRTIRVFDHEHAQRSKLRVETRKWFISKVLPKKYGEKLDLTSGGKPFKEPRRAVIQYVVPKDPEKTKGK